MVFSFSSLSLFSFLNMKKGEKFSECGREIVVCAYNTAQHRRNENAVVKRKYLCNVNVYPPPLPPQSLAQLCMLSAIICLHCARENFCDIFMEMTFLAFHTHTHILRNK
jgi:hypothetical protein